MNRFLRVAVILSCALWFWPISLRSQALWFRFADDPVMWASGIPGDFDEAGALAPAVVRKDSVYRMWYTGFSSESQKYSIGFAYSVDGIEWEKHGTQAVLPEDPQNPFESVWVWASCAVIEDNGYLLYYSGFDGSVWKLAVAYSRNGVEWERNAVNPILLPGPPGSWDDKDTYSASVVKVGPGDYRMWYSGQNTYFDVEVGLATSTDGVYWAKHAENPVLKMGDARYWDNRGVSSPRVVLVDNTFHMFYLGTGGLGGPHVGYAYSTDGIHWKKYSLNPVLTAGGGSLYWTQIGDPAVVYEEGAYRMWLGINFSAWAIGYAISEPRPVGVGIDLAGAPLSYGLDQNYPNPFNPSTTIRYGLPSRSHVTLSVFNALGQQVATLVQGEQEAGYHEVQFDGSGLASGVYLYRLQAGDFIQSLKLTLLR